MRSQHSLIDWTYSGKPDGFFGTGATASERTLVWVFGLTGTALLGFFWWRSPLPWAWWQQVLALLIALDVLGGVVANSLNSCKRYYHAPLQPEEGGLRSFTKNHFVFSLLHVHTLIVGLLFGSMNWIYGFAWYLALVASTLLVRRTPLYLQRPLAMGLILFAILLNFYVIPPVRGFEWLAPALFLKIVYGHNVREEPYRALS